MRKYRVHIVLIACFVWLVVYGCNHSPQEIAKTPENTFAVKGSVREMDMNPAPPPAFPEYEGKTEFMSYCAICHSLKYNSSAPDFPE